MFALATSGASALGHGLPSREGVDHLQCRLSVEDETNERPASRQILEMGLSVAISVRETCEPLPRVEARRGMFKLWSPTWE